MSVTKGQQQARNRFANYCNRIDRYAGGFQRRADENGKQYVGCQFCVCRYTEHTLPEAGKIADVNADLINAYKRVFNFWARRRMKSFTIDDVEATADDTNIVRIGAATFDLRIIKKMLKTFGKTATLNVEIGEPNSSLYITDQDGNEGILCPIRQK